MNSPSPNMALQRTRGLAAAQFLRSAGATSAVQDPPVGRSPLNARSLGGPGLRSWVNRVGGLPLLMLACLGIAPVKAQERDFDTPYFQSARDDFLAKSADPARRVSAIREMVIRDAVQARPLIATVLKDPSPDVRREAAWWLAAYGDTRGLDIQAACFANPTCSAASDAALLLSVSRRPEYGPVVRRRVEALFRAGVKGSSWQGPRESVSLLAYGTIALARMGAKEDCDLIIDVVRARPRHDNRLLEALGYLDDPRAQDMLWSAHKELLKEPRCDTRGLGVEALLPLSRLGDSLAIRKMKDVLLGVGVPECPPINGWPMLSADGSLAFESLRSGDAKAFAETVLEVAARDPEGVGTRQAWEALGIMHPQGYGERVLELAVSRRPHWKYVSRDLLNTVVIALDPDLNSRFWSYFDVEVVPDMRGEKALVSQGLGRLKFRGSRWWTSD